MTRLIALMALLVAVLPVSTQAYLVDLDIDFTDAPLGPTLQRRGPAFGEPLPGFFDAVSDEVVNVFGDRKVQIVDTAAPGPELLYWGFDGGRMLDHGIVVLECNFSTSDLTQASLAIVGSDEVFDIFFNLLLQPNGDLAYLDNATPNPTVFGTYIPREDLRVRVTLDFSNLNYDFELNGTTVFTNKSHGVISGVQRMILGFAPGATGVSMIQDEFLVYRTGGLTSDPFVDRLLIATFNAEPLGPVGTGGAGNNQPVSIPPGGANVVMESLNQTLEMCDRSNTTESTAFELLQSQEVSQGLACTLFDLWFDQVDEYEVEFREQGTGGNLYMSLYFDSSGMMSILDNTGTVADVLPYGANDWMEFRVGFNLDEDLYYVWVDGDVVLRGRNHGFPNGDGIGRLEFAYLADANSNQCMRIDDVVVFAQNTAATAAPGALPMVQTPRLMPASPNPFNPATQLRFELPRSCMASLRLYDAAGRWVATLLDRSLAAGPHQLTWDGRNARGRPVRSGVYFARLRTGGFEDRQKLVLLK